jgi:hypothetical protein
MSDDPDDLLREFEDAERGLKRLSLPRLAGRCTQAKDSGVHQRDERGDRLRHWIARRIKRGALTDWLRLRLLPWLGDQTTRGTRAGEAFWSALERDERERLWNILERFRSERRTALSSLDLNQA